MTTPRRKKKTDIITLLKFGFVGALNTAIDYGMFLVFFHLALIPYVPAHGLSYSCGLVNSFIWNKLWTFRAGKRVTARETAAFIAVNLASLGLSGLILALCVEYLAFPENLAKLCALPFSLAVNFLGSRYWVFRNTTVGESHRGTEGGKEK